MDPFQDRVRGGLPTRPVFADVRPGDASVAGRHPDRVLLLCWPPYDDPMARDALSAYGGDLVVYVGEPRGGCSGDDAFFDLLDRDWTLEHLHVPARWEGAYDDVAVYRRRGPDPREKRLGC